MTGNELQKTMEGLNLSPEDVASLAGYSRAYIWRLAKTGNDLLPAPAEARIQGALLHFGRKATAAFMALTGGDAA